MTISEIPNQPVEVIVNVSSGSGHTPEWAEELIGKFRAAGMTAHVTLAQDGQQIIDAAQRAVKRSDGIVVAGGGDGTINAVAGELVGTSTALGVLPLGTLNHFAKDLRLPMGLDEAICTIATGRHAKVDVGEVNGKVFLNNSSLGLYPDIVHEREKQQQRLGRGKWRAFVWAVLAALRRYSFLTVDLTIGGKKYTRRTPFVFIGNNAYLMEGFNVGTRAHLDAGVLCLYSAQRPGRLRLVRLAISAALGRLRQEKDFDMVTTGQIDIQTRHKTLRVSTDGEVCQMNTPLRYRVRPGVLNVTVPDPGKSGS